ncbi:hypothetical protein GALMADRAFT_816067 [Galerina marginata CBS 339.88]|uniref:Uncharacterized protein n=1 Tax=Galerina marginata (strain CBS 339.88) TaxID=685588 RepID=A0A067TTK7_GALM3|nr:hypothetical protein GALMADRAFT_816067 [Galerina marginata CBS 339.88]
MSSPICVTQGNLITIAFSNKTATQKITFKSSPRLPLTCKGRQTASQIILILTKTVKLLSITLSQSEKYHRISLKASPLFKYIALRIRHPISYSQPDPNPKFNCRKHSRKRGIGYTCNFQNDNYSTPNRTCRPAIGSCSPMDSAALALGLLFNQRLRDGRYFDLLSFAQALCGSACASVGANSADRRTADWLMRIVL